VRRDHKKKSEKIGFFQDFSDFFWIFSHKKKSEKIGFFRDFSDFFWIFSDQMDNFWTTLHTFWIMVDNL
jgi:hypothetical protein